MTDKLGIINNFAGEVLSLNQKKAPYLGIGMNEETRQHKVVWNVKGWCKQVPTGLTYEEAQQIQKCISEGVLVTGRHYLPAKVKDPATIKKYLDTIRQPLMPVAKKPFQELVRKKQEGNYSAKEIIVACIQEEEKLRRRADWLRFLGDGLKACTGPELIVEDYHDDPEAYQVVINTETNQIVADSRPVEARKPKGKKVVVVETNQATQEERAKALDNYLGDSI